MKPPRSIRRPQRPFRSPFAFVLAAGLAACAAPAPEDGHRFTISEEGGLTIARTEYIAWPEIPRVGSMAPEFWPSPTGGWIVHLLASSDMAARPTRISRTGR